MKIYVYVIYFPTSNKYYVGQTCNLKGTLLSRHLKSGSLVCKALWKYDDWQVTIMHIVKTRDEANRLEIDHIRNFNSINPNGYNLTRGGEGGAGFTGKKHSKNWIENYSKNNPMKRLEIAAKISEIMQGNKRAQGKNNGMKKIYKCKENVIYKM